MINDRSKRNMLNIKWTRTRHGIYDDYVVYDYDERICNDAYEQGTQSLWGTSAHDINNTYGIQVYMALPVYMRKIAEIKEEW